MTCISSWWNFTPWSFLSPWSMTQNKGNLKLCLITWVGLIGYVLLNIKLFKDPSSTEACFRQRNMWRLSTNVRTSMTYLKPAAHTAIINIESSLMQSEHVTSCYVNIYALICSHIGCIFSQSLLQCILGSVNVAASHLGQNEVFEGIFYNYTAHLSGTAFVSGEHWNSA